MGIGEITLFQITVDKSNLLEVRPDKRGEVEVGIVEIKTQSINPVKITVQNVRILKDGVCNRRTCKNTGNHIGMGEIAGRKIGEIEKTELEGRIFEVIPHMLGV